jgi:hypothetical protein
VPAVQNRCSLCAFRLAIHPVCVRPGAACLDAAWKRTLNSCLRLTSLTCMRHPRQSGPSEMKGNERLKAQRGHSKDELQASAQVLLDELSAKDHWSADG